MVWNTVERVGAEENKKKNLYTRFILLVFVGIKAGLAIDDFAPRLSFFWGIGMNFYMVSFALVRS